MILWFPLIAIELQPDLSCPRFRHWSARHEARAPPEGTCPHTRQPRPGHSSQGTHGVGINVISQCKISIYIVQSFGENGQIFWDPPPLPA